MSQPDNYVTCRCQYCDKGIEFNAAELSEENSVIPCPHCGLETKLFIPPVAEAKCSCQHCGKPIEIDDPDLLKLVDETTTMPCPHCGLETKLFSPQSAADSPTADTFGKRKADFLAKLEAERPEREAQLQRLREIADRRVIYSKLDTLTLEGDSVKIQRRGIANALAAGLNGERTILISSLTSVQLKPGNWFSPGYILFSYAGNKPFMGGIIDATQDPDAFIFGQELNEEIAEFKTRVEEKMRESKRSVPISNPSSTMTDEIRKLAELKQQGLLSQEEFDAAKRKLLH